MPMGKADVSLKGYLSNKERFADLFNGYLFRIDWNRSGVSPIGIEKKLAVV